MIPAVYPSWFQKSSPAMLLPPPSFPPPLSFLCIRDRAGPMVSNHSVFKIPRHSSLDYRYISIWCRRGNLWSGPTFIFSHEVSGVLEAWPLREASRAPVSDPSCHVSKNHLKSRQTTCEGLRNRGKREETGQLLPAVVGRKAPSKRYHDSFYCSG